MKKFIYKLLKKILDYIYDYDYTAKYRQLNIASSAKLHATEIIGNNIAIGEYTYINPMSSLSSGLTSSITIGKHCAIGRNVHISSKTHDLKRPTTDEQHTHINSIEKDIIIGNYVWIGDHVFIKEGVKIHDHAIIGSNSVVVEDVQPFEIVGGVPAKHIRFNTEHYRYESTSPGHLVSK